MGTWKIFQGASFVGASFCFMQWLRIVVSTVQPEMVSCNVHGPFGVIVPEGVLFVGTSVFLFLFGVQWWQEEDSLAVWAWLFLIAGGFSNLLERLFFDCTTDYLRVGGFPAFNVADVFLTFGAFGILGGWLGRSKKE